MTSYANVDLSQLEKVGFDLADQLSQGEPFCLHLVGPMGVGKTTFAGAILRGLGLSSSIPVTSPTFTYLNEYRVAQKLYGHLDLYRSNAPVSLEELGASDVRSFAGILVEWPEKLFGEPPTARLTMQVETDKTRSIDFEIL